MALVKCPECGRENVSDSAVACPTCGFAIKEHYDKIKEQKMQEKIYNQKLKNVQKPEKPKISSIFEFKFGLFFVISCIFCFFMMVNNNEVGLYFFYPMLLGSFIFLHDAKKQYDKLMDKYNISISNFEKYKRMIVREREEEALKEASKEASKPKCPNCGSKNIKKISTSSRVVSVLAVGLASGKIGKQFKCNKCGYKW